MILPLFDYDNPGELNAELECHTYCLAPSILEHPRYAIHMITVAGIKTQKLSNS